MHPPPELVQPRVDPTRFLVEARQRVHDFQRGTDRWGSRTTRLYTAAVDNTLRGIVEPLEESGDPSAAWLRDEFCVVATGGYARKALSPWSDVDVLLVTAGPAEEQLEAVGRKLLYPLWDAGLQVGQRPGTVEEIVTSAEGDVAARTSLLDLRYVSGSRALYDRLHRSVDTAMKRWRPELLERVRRENLQRFARYGQSVFLLEPHVKEGKGGLRDFHWLGWITKLARGLRGDYDQLLSGLVEPDHYRELIAAHEFLLRVRVQLHLHQGRASDRLVFEAQEPVARALGFKKSRGLLAVEHFMGQYYRHAYSMAHLSGLYVARLLGFYWDEPEPVAESPSGPARTLEVGPSAPAVGVPWSEESSSPDGLFLLRRGSVRCSRPEELARDPRLVLSLFEFLQDVGGRLHHDTVEHVRAALGRVHKRFRCDPEVGSRFLELLEGPRVFRTLAAMHRSGFLGRYIPEFGACFCQAQHNRVHLYTVDVHSLYVVRELEALGDPELLARAPRFAHCWVERSSRAALVLAGLFHDIAKAKGSAHSRVGADMAGVILRRMGMAEEEVERVQWLVRHHLLLPDTAYHRDLYDPKTRSRLQAVIPDRSHLDDLMALTWADTRATNPSLMTSWKQTLLEQAHAVARGVLDPAGGLLPAVSDRATLRTRVEALLLAEVGARKAEQLASQVLAGEASLPGYLDRSSPELLATHAVLLDRLTGALAAGELEPVVTEVRELPEAGVSQWIVCTRDRPGVFSLFAGAITAVGLSIRAAEALTRADGVCIDTFSVTDSQGRPVLDEGRWRRLDRLVGRVARSEQDLQDVLERARRDAPPPPGPGALSLKRVEVTNELSDTATVVEVVTSDRTGLVYDITQVLLDFGLDLRVAKIATRQDLGSDTFYVVNRRGGPIGRRRSRQLAAALRERFG